MGRLFWKFFLAFWLALLVAGIGVGTAVWLRHNAELAERAEHNQEKEPAALLGQDEYEHPHHAGHPPPADAPLPWPPEPGFQHPRHFPPPPRSRPSAVLSILIGLFASVLSSAALAWYFARPIRSLRQAFSAVAKGDLNTRVGPGMGRRRDELSDLGRDFDHMVGQIHNLVNAQQRLLHDVSHELRSPLARIQAAIGLAQQQPEKIQDTLQRIERESQRISDLVGELLELSRLEVGVGSGDVHEFDIGGLLDDIVADACFEAKQLGLQIEYTALADDTLVKGSGELLHRAFENVLRNALQHCKQRGQIQVLAHFNPNSKLFQLMISDEGPGVAESDLTAIFEPFFRSGNTAKSNSSGLGLAIAKRAIIAHGGSIAAFNRPAGGLLVSIEIALGI